MNPIFKISAAGALLAIIAVPADAHDKSSGEHSGAKAEHGGGYHGQKNHESSRRHGAGMGGHGIMTFDTDGDGRVSQAEIDKFRGDRLSKFDTDGNGNLTLKEYEALWLAAMRGKMVDRFQYLDADGDAVVTLEEFKKPYANMVRRMDKNGDGVLSREHGKKDEKK